jgi:GT2 family glycosyltransferase
MNDFGQLYKYDASFMSEVGDFSMEFEGVQDLDFALRAISHARKEQIRHIPRVLYHWRICETSTALSFNKKENILSTAVKSVQKYLDNNIPGATCTTSTNGFRRITFPLFSKPLVSILIPSGGCYHTLKRCIDSITKKTRYINFEILVDNGCFQEDTVKYLAEISDQRVRVIRFKRTANEKFNYSLLNNRLAREARGDVLVLMNDDVEVINSDWLDEMVSIALMPSVGAVGAKLYYFNDTVQHGGVAMGIGGTCDHLFVGLHKEEAGYYGYLYVQREVSVVTAAVFAVKKSLYFDFGGLNEDLAVAFNDVDFCLRLLRTGYVNVWTPFAELYHHESFTRGFNSDGPGEVDYINTNYFDLIRRDPYYPWAFSRKSKFHSFILRGADEI